MVGNHQCCGEKNQQHLTMTPEYITRPIGPYMFIRVGRSVLCETGMVMPGSAPPRRWQAALELENPEFRFAGQSVYAFMLEDEVMYVGQYTNTLQARMLNRGRYFWHGDAVDNRIYRLLKIGKSVTLWLSLDPFIGVGKGEKLNISHTIEYELIRLLGPQWNTLHKQQKLSQRRAEVATIISN